MCLKPRTCPGEYHAPRSGEKIIIKINKIKLHANDLNSNYLQAVQENMGRSVSHLGGASGWGKRHTSIYCQSITRAAST